MKIIKIILVIACFSFMNASFIQHKEGIIKDTKSGFLWQDTKDAKTKKMNFKEAVSYCKNLDISSEKNWELPGFIELFSIVNTKRYNPSLPKEFKNYAAADYWSTKVFSHGVSNEAFVVEFKAGAFNRKQMDEKFYVRCYKK